MSPFASPGEPGFGPKPGSLFFPDVPSGMRLLLGRRESTTKSRCTWYALGDEPDPFMPSFSFWLADFADHLEKGEFAHSEEDGCLMYADEIGD
jgi:hypothetical protein